ncbi:GDSL-type esterase/lipase family protein [Actinoplanes sp. NEAU-A12]|uniref:GDSL-type esterase/lipase family protein n=1 Tax=Actinoplanes sandaracinus TaxID=3045177 RepID=A0ABT6WUW5_9ACTN|nr:GDSL-type esterase/lipase family protein [Actinoplanes sandaracinus]MDI6103415.1 GDSL-type esterase/lipase family protein [Actinoplanes sandaracinus]
MADVYGPMRRTSIFILALSALLGVARHEAPALTVWVMFAIFISVATVWIRGQYADSLDGRQWVIPYWIGVPAFVLATGLAVLIFVADPSTFDKGLLTISALALVYLVIGSGLTQLRQSPSVPLAGRSIRTGHCGAGMTAAGLTCVVGGAALLGPAELELAGALLIAGGVLVLIPVGLALWSEGLLRRLCEQNVANSRLLALGGAGLAVFAGATAAAAYFSHSTWLVTVLVVLGLLMVALVSTTQADIVAVTAVVALMGVTPPQAPKAETPAPGKASKVLVALGDSFMSGEGAQVYHQGTDDGGENECRRSPTAWAALAAQNRMNFDGLMFLACSGARTENILSTAGDAFYSETRQGVIGMPEPSAQPGEGHTQLDAYGLRGRFRTELVVLSIGGNDAGFSTIGLMCMAPGNCDEKEYLWTESIDQVRAQLHETYRQVNQAFPGVPVVVVPYPDPIRFVEGRKCRQVALSESEQRFIHTYLTHHLNSTIRDVAQQYGFYYLDEMQNALADRGLQLCDEHNGERPGINFIGLRSVRGVAEQRFNPANWLHSSLHPNERGHAAMLGVFETWLAAKKTVIKEQPRAVPSRAVTPAPTGPGNGRGDVSQRLGPCGLFDTTGGDGCRTQGQRWAYQQLGHTLLGKALWLWIALACGGAWCAAIAFFGYRRRVWAHRLSCPLSEDRS